LKTPKHLQHLKKKKKRRRTRAWLQRWNEASPASEGTAFVVGKRKGEEEKEDRMSLWRWWCAFVALLFVIGMGAPLS